MSNLKETKDLLNKLGIGFKEEEIEDRIIINLTVGNKKVVGYKDFCSEFHFSLDGNFIEMGIWEE